MTLKEIWRCWDKFWFEPRSTLSLCLFRIVFGLILLERELLLIPDWLNWYGAKGVFSLNSAQNFWGSPCINLFLFIPQTDAAIYAYLVVTIVVLVCFTLGFFTRASSIATFLLLVSLDHRNNFLLNGGDDFIRCCTFWMMFAPAGELLSLDRFLKQKRGVKLEADPKCSIWPLRLLQLQLIAVYNQAFWTKAVSRDWLDGTPVYYVLHMRDYLRFPLPLNIDNIWVSRLLSWGTLVVEFALASLLWIKEFRYYILAAGVLFHLGLEYTMNLPVFEQVMMASYVLFVDPADIRRVLRRLPKSKWTATIAEGELAQTVSGS